MPSMISVVLALSIAFAAILAPTSSVAASPGESTAATTRAERFAALQARAAAQGEVALIVRLDQFDLPLPALAPPAQQARLEAIRATREQLLADLAAWGSLGNVKRFQFSPYVAFTSGARVIGVLQHHPLALDVVEDELRAPTLEQTVPLIQADSSAWASGWTGAGQSVAILDSGVDKTHPFLAGKVVSEACYSTTSSAYGSTSLCPGGQDSTAVGSGVNCTGISGCEHGTHVAGIAAGKDPGSVGRNGVAKDATIVAIQVFSRFDNPNYCGSSAPCILSWSSDQMQALERVYALRTSRAIAAANMSLGGGKYTSACDGDSLKASIDNLRTAGIAVAIASGNDGYTNAISAPACISSAVSVGSTCDSANGYCAGVDAVASYSNIASFVSLLAPGSAVTSSVPGGGYATWHGTSMATPHVAGAFAIKKQQSPTASVSAILDDFRATGGVVNDTRSGGTVTGMKRIRFAAATSYTLTVSGGGNGTVTSSPTGIACGATCSASFAAGSIVTLTASALAGYEFAGWGGACSGTGSCVVTLNGNSAVSAVFQATNHAPVAQADSYDGTAGVVMNVTAAMGVLKNDSDPDGNPLTAVLAAGPANGTLSLAADGSFTYTPRSGFWGTDSFTYRASDGKLASATTTVTLNIAQATSCTAPTAPTTLTASALRKLRIQLAWTDRSNNETGFIIERSIDGGSTWTPRVTVGTNVTAYTDSGLTAGQTYSYRVSASNGCGTSAATNTASATAKR
jgi:subtilisin family serine protease